jgi:hypothetical protein
MLHNPELDGRFSDSAVLRAFELLEPDLAAFAEKHSLFVRKFTTIPCGASTSSTLPEAGDQCS